MAVCSMCRALLICVGGWPVGQEQPGRGEALVVEVGTGPPLAARWTGQRVMKGREEEKKGVGYYQGRGGGCKGRGEVTAEGCTRCFECIERQGHEPQAA